MRMAVIGDIHGNSAALKAVLTDIDAQGVDVIVNLGDHFSGPLDVKGTADQLLSRDMTHILGNHDRWLIEQAPAQMGLSDLQAYEQLESSHRDWLSSLEPTAHIDDIFICHGTPSSDVIYWMEEVKPNGSVCMATQDHIEHHAEGIKASLILCGHTHLPRVVRLQDERLLVNPGSVGCPGYDDDTPVYHVMQTGLPDALYAIVERSHSQWTVNLRSVPYDSSPMVKLANNAKRSEWARALATGWV